MASQQHNNGELLTIALLAGGAYLAWRMGLFAALGSPAATTTATATTSPVTPATPALSAGGVPSSTDADTHTSAGQPNLELFNSTNYNDYWTTITGSSPSVQSETIGSIKTNGGTFMLYSQPNYQGNSVAVTGLDFPDATSILASLGGAIQSVKAL